MNVFTAVGRVTEDATLRFTNNQKPVLGFSLATDAGFGEKKHTLYVRCSLWGKRGESLAEYVKKGLAISVSGECDMQSWEANGRSGTNLELNVRGIALHGNKSDKKEEQSGFRSNDEMGDEPC